MPLPPFPTPFVLPVYGRRLRHQAALARGVLGAVDHTDTRGKA